MVNEVALDTYFSCSNRTTILSSIGFSSAPYRNGYFKLPRMNLLLYREEFESFATFIQGVEDQNHLPIVLDQTMQSF